MIADINGEERDLSGGAQRRRLRGHHHGRQPAGSTRSATRPPTSLPKRSSTCSRTQAGIGPLAEDGFYYDFLSARRRHHARGPRAHRHAHARDHRRTPGLPPRRDPGRRRPPDLRRPPAEARDHRRRPRPTDVGKQRAVLAPFARTRTHRPSQWHPPFRGRPGFIDPRVPRRGHGSAPGPLQAHAGGRRLLARRRAQPAAAAHLRTAWDSDKALEAHLHQLEEAAKRDHRKLGVELDLFHFLPEIGSGLPVYHPKGGLVRKLMEDYSRAEHERWLRVRVHPAHRQGRVVRDQRSPQLVRRQHVPAHGARRGAEVLPQADELPHARALSVSRSGRTGNCRCGSSSSARCTGTRSRAWCTACYGRGIHAGRRTSSARPSSSPPS